MKKNNAAIPSALVLIVLIMGVFYWMMPQSYDETEAPLSTFSTKRALATVRQMTGQAHYVGSKNHEVVAKYLMRELSDLGLQPSIQEGFTMTEKGTLVRSKNILARIKGSTSGKALLLLSHYDSAPHSFSHGASDDASGVATILEGVRAYLHNKTSHKNDIILLFTDAEELGLNGAALFVTEHHWAKDVGLVLNFEARGTSGPSYMLMETNEGNEAMVEAFGQGGVRYPVSNSLMYSIYKMLPNDTDLTVFRTEGKIQGFNFAFIDNHFNYHTAQDTYQHLDPTTLAHQGTYLMPLLGYFSNADLGHLNSKSDEVYFTIPFGFIHYPFSWIMPMWCLALVLLVGFTFVGLGKQLLRLDEIIKGLFNVLGALVVGGIVTFGGWKLLLYCYPQYSEILQGFTYNGRDYIYAFICVTLSICFLIYHKEPKRHSEMSQLVAPLFIGIILNLVLALKLAGAGFLIIPVLASTLMLGYYVLTQKTVAWLQVLLSLPTIIILVPFIVMFPIGLGLKILFGSAVLTALCFSYLLPIVSCFGQKKLWATSLFVLALALFVKAHLNSDYAKGMAKPNSLVYLWNGDTNKAYWTTYDKHLDEWTKGYLGEKPMSAKSLNTDKLYSKYGTEFTYMAAAPLKNIAKPSIDFAMDSVVGNRRYLKIVISPNRKVNRYDIFSGNDINQAQFKANGVRSIDLESTIISQDNHKLLSYYVVDQIPLTLEFSIPATQKLDMSLVESSFDLMSNPLFSMAKRRDWMIPTPFVLNDAVVIKERIR